MWCPGSIELAAVAGKEVTRTGERDHGPGGIVDHDHGSMRDVAVFERLQSLCDDGLNLLLQRGIKRGADRGGTGFATKHFHGMRSFKPAAEAL